MNIFKTISAIISTPVGIVYLLLLTRWRYSRRSAISISGIFGAAVFRLNLYFEIFPSEFMNDFMIRMVNIALCFILALIISEYRDARMMFSFLTSCVFIILGEIFSETLRVGLDLEMGAILSKLIIAAAIIALVVKFIRGPLLRMIEDMKGGWGKLCVIPFCFLITFFLISSYPTPINRRPENLWAAGGLFVSMIFTYIIIFQLFHQLQLQHEAEENIGNMELQMAFLQRQMEALSKKDEKLKLFQHDLRHYTNAVAACIRGDKPQEALDILGSMNSAIKDAGIAVTYYCDNALLNAVLSTYIQDAEKAGIQVTAKFGLPAKLSCSPEELAVVFANCIENAVNACARMEGEKKIFISCGIVNSQLFIEIANTYTGEIIFDEKTNLPMAALADASDHGIGSQSVAAFVAKNKGHLLYQVKDGWFKVQIVLPAKKQPQADA